MRRTQPENAAFKVSGRAKDCMRPLKPEKGPIESPEECSSVRTLILAQ